MAGRLVRLAALGLVLPVLAAAAAATTARVFDLKYLRLGDAAQLVQPLLSEEGSLTLEPRSSRLTVQDRPEVVDRVARLLLAADRPPARYRVLAQLYEATTEPGGGDATAADLKLGEVLRFTSFRLVGATHLEGEVGGAARADLGDEFVIRFRVEPGDHGVSAASGAAGAPVVRPPDLGRGGGAAAGSRIRLDQLILLRIVASRQTEVLRSSVVLSTGQQVVLAASSSESARRGLVLVLRAEAPEA